MNRSIAMVLRSAAASALVTSIGMAGAPPAWAQFGNARVVGTSSAAAAQSGAAVVREALKWVGVPRYQMGGTDLRRQIDTSHFVEAVFRRAGQPVPDPPVHNQETYGQIVHWKKGTAERGGKKITFATTAPLTALRPGDRLIFQAQPDDLGGAGTHHTAIYIGPYGKMKHAIIHCNAHARTVSIDDLQTPFLWQIYRYAVRGMQRDARRPVTAPSR